VVGGWGAGRRGGIEMFGGQGGGEAIAGLGWRLEREEVGLGRLVLKGSEFKLARLMNGHGNLKYKHFSLWEGPLCGPGGC
jgi:hypothetical protein